MSLALILTACAAIVRSRSGASPKSEHQVGFPAELYARSIPPDNPQTPAKIALGQALFVEQRLSADNLQHCEGCHNYALGFTDQKRTSVGIDSQSGRRNAPTILNAMFNSSLFWDGRASTLEEQAKSPILNPIEMGMKSPDEVVAKIKAMPAYRDAFERVFGREVNFDDIARALASYERNSRSTRRSIATWQARSVRSMSRRNVDGKSSAAVDDVSGATPGVASVRCSTTGASIMWAYPPARHSRATRLRCVTIATATTRRNSIVSRLTAA
jgi:cytochrome c peroxidase